VPWAVSLPYSGEAFSLPPSLHILGTMNTADRSIALLDTALRRRFAFEEMPPQPDLLGAVDGAGLQLLFTRLNERVEYLFDRDYLISHPFLINATTRAEVDEIMCCKVIPLLAEYFHEDWERIVAVLGGQGAQGFIDRTALPVRLDIDSEGEDRFRYTVRLAFGETRCTARPFLHPRSRANLTFGLQLPLAPRTLASTG
jgi:5-methylcytosine-specific restriction protein B